MALPQAWASRWSRWQGRIVPAWLISPGGRAVFMAEVQPRRASDATETARRVFFIVQPFWFVSVARSSGGQTALSRLPREWFRTELTGMAALVVGSSAAFALRRRLWVRL